MTQKLRALDDFPEGTLSILGTHMATTWSGTHLPVGHLFGQWLMWEGLAHCENYDPWANGPEL